MNITWIETERYKEEKINEDKQVTFLYGIKEVIRIEKLIKVEQIESIIKTRISNIYKKCLKIVSKTIKFRIKKLSDWKIKRQLKLINKNS